MHFMKTFSLFPLYLISTAVAGTIAQFEAAMDALANQAVALDAIVCALTPQTPPATAQRISPALQSLTNAINSAIDIANRIPTITDTTGEVNLLELYGLFANTVWEMVDELIFQRPNLVGVFGLRASTYTQLQNLNTAFQDLVELTVGLVGGTAYKTEAHYYYGDDTNPLRAVIKSIKTALAAFSPRRNAGIE